MFDALLTVFFLEDVVGWRLDRGVMGIMGRTG